MNRRRILVIADDFTGAAEIAGIGSRYGMIAEIIRDASIDSTADLLVVDSDSRSLKPELAAKRVRDILRAVATGEFELVFKKIDSLLRGPVLAELEAAMQALGKTAAVLAPANPSRGRTIGDGEYRIEGVPLHRTPMANDPEYPRQSSRVLDLLGPLPTGVTLADSRSSSEVQTWAQQVDDRTLPAGGADFFTSILSNLGFSARAARSILGPGRILMVCGSASESSNVAIGIAMERGIRVLQMLDQAEDLATAIRLALSERPSAILTTGPMREVQGGELVQKMALTVGRVLDATTVDELLIEGGSTSAAILERMGWRRFNDCIELSPGIVRMAIVGHRTHLTVKPGSYPWPEVVWKQLSGNVTI